MPASAVAVPALTAPPGSAAPFLQASGCKGSNGVGGRPRPAADPAKVEEAAALLRGAHRPLLVVGKGAAFACEGTS